MTNRHAPFLFSLLLGLSFTIHTLYGEEPGLLPAAGDDAQPLTPNASVIPIQDDAHFRDVCLIDSEVGFAVGDQGAIWKTNDGGTTWKWQPTGFSYSLTDVCFLTREVGWIAARGVHPYGQQGWGLILHTRDGGATWTKLPQNQLPPLNTVQFFDLENGIAVGEASTRYPSGLLITQDGGKSWIARPGTADKNWFTAEFHNIDDGLVAGAFGQIAKATRDNVAPVTFSQFDLKAMRDVSYSDSGKSWLVGEGASLFYSDNRGVRWLEPAGQLPQTLPLMQDFNTVAQFGTHVWVTGAPGSVIWHSPDEGQNWQPQYTGQTLPLERLVFNSETHGCAVGALGTILLTRDGGRTWQKVKGADRRVALMQVAPAREEIDIPLLAQQSAEQGYRSLVYLPIRDDVPRMHYRGTASGGLLSNSAVLSANGSHAITAWQFPLARPDLELDRAGLIDELNRWSDGNLGPVMLESLVCLLRTWRPDVVVLPVSDPKNEINTLLEQAFTQAIASAGDPTRFLQQQETLGLKPWKISRVYYRAAEGVSGDVEIDPYDVLQRKSQTILEFSTSGLRQSGANVESIRPVHYQLAPQSNGTLPKVARNFFGGIILAPGGDARRELDPLDERRLEQAHLIARRRKHLTAIGELALNEQGHADQMLSELRESLRGFSSRQGAEQLIRLANQYREQGHSELEEQVLIELINMYPREPLTAQTITRLFHLWTSTEVAWLRSRDLTVGRETARFNSGEQQRVIEKALALRGQRGENAPPLVVRGEKDPFERNRQGGDLRVGPGQDWRNEQVKLWRSQAIKLAGYLQEADSYGFHTPAVQFPLAALMGEMTPADRKQFNNAEANNPLALFDLLGAGTRPLKKCRKTTTPPMLDGLLSDPCWEAAEEIRLESDSPLRPGSDMRPLIFVAYDDEFLYVAGSFPKFDIPYARITTAGRDHDQAAAGFDRLQMSIDLDADYHSAYEFTFDQRGQVSESCFGDSRWNPQLYLAVQEDETNWRIEGAIPLDELCPHPPKAGQRWAVCFQRVVPSVGLQSWSRPSDINILPSSYGTLTFE